MSPAWRRGELSGIALIAAGFLLVAMSLGGYLIGALIDRVFHTAPIGAVVGLLIGTLVGFWDIYRIAMWAMRRQPPPPPPPQEQRERPGAGDALPNGEDHD